MSYKGPAGELTFSKCWRESSLLHLHVFNDKQTRTPSCSRSHQYLPWKGAFWKVWQHPPGRTPAELQLALVTRHWDNGHPDAGWVLFGRTRVLGVRGEHGE